MVQSAAKLISVDEFITRYGDDNRYELIDGELIEMEATGLHEQVAAFVGRKLNVEIDRHDNPYCIPHRCLIKRLVSSIFPELQLTAKQVFISSTLGTVT